MRVLDELADTLHIVQGHGTRHIAKSLQLEAQFTKPVNPVMWGELQQRLLFTLPSLERWEGRWTFPPGCMTVFDVADCLATARPDLERWKMGTLAVWREAQIFAGVRETLVDAASVDEHQVTREARLVQDLGME